MSFRIASHMGTFGTHFKHPGPSQASGQCQTQLLRARFGGPARAITNTYISTLDAAMPQRASAASSLTRASTQRAPAGVTSFFQKGAWVLR